MGKFDGKMALFLEKKYIFEFLTLENTRGRFLLPGPRSSWARKEQKTRLKSPPSCTIHVRTAVGRRRSRPWFPGMKNRGSRAPLFMMHVVDGELPGWCAAQQECWQENSH